MSLISETILSTSTHISDSTPQVLVGNKFQGDGYYGRSDGLHTVQYSVNGFLGTINLQGSLAINPSDEDWFTVYSETHTIDNDEGFTGSKIINFTGNYVWIRAFINNWTDGTIISIKLNH